MSGFRLGSFLGSVYLLFFVVGSAQTVTISVPNTTYYLNESKTINVQITNTTGAAVSGLYRASVVAGFDINGAGVSYTSSTQCQWSRE